MKNLLLVVMAVSLSIILVGCSQPTIVFELNGKSNVTVLQDRDYNDLGFTAEKSGGLDLSKYVTISESISTEFVGTKTITYTLDYEDTKQTITREVEVVPALTKEMAYDFFSNVDLSLMEFFPDSFRESIDPLSVVQNTNCTLNEDDKYTFADEVYDYCITSTDSILPMSDSYVDIYSSMKQFELIEKYTNTILHSMDSVSDVTHIDGIDVMTPYGSIGMEITDVAVSW